jgi:hypothetical protein
MDDGGFNGGRSLGEKNGMYGKTHTDEVKLKLKKLNSDGRNKGENNRQYGISPKDRMSEEVYTQWKENHKKIIGDKNPNYGNKKLSEFYSNNPDIALEKQSRPGKQNGRATPIIMINIKTNEEFYFDYILEGCDYIFKHNLMPLCTKIKSIYLNILKSLKNEQDVYGLKFTKQKIIIKQDNPVPSLIGNNLEG